MWEARGCNNVGLRGAVIAASIAAAGVTGCATALTLSRDRTADLLATPAGHQIKNPDSWPRIYAGISSDAYAFSLAFRGADVDVLFWLSLLDMPLSLAADTIALPYTIYDQCRNGSVHAERHPEAWDFVNKPLIGSRTSAAPVPPTASAPQPDADAGQSTEPTVEARARAVAMSVEDWCRWQAAHGDYAVECAKALSQ